MNKLRPIIQYEKIKILKDVPDYDIKKGYTGVVVEIAKHLQTGELGYLIEVFDENKNTIDEVFLDRSILEVDDEEDKTYLEKIHGRNFSYLLNNVTNTI